MRKHPCADEVRALRRERVSAAKLKRLGYVRQIYEAELRSGWGSYQGAIAAARVAEDRPVMARDALQRWANHVEGVVSGRPADVVPIRLGR